MTVPCIRSKFGFCKFGNQCLNTHFNVTCEKKNCTGRNCDKRHPAACYFYDMFGRCKFGTFCSYRHTKTKEQMHQEDFERLRNEVIDLKKKLKESKPEENSFKCDYCEHSYKTEKKLRQHKSRKHEGELLNETDPIDDCCLENSRKVERLEKFVKRLQNKVEELELEQYKNDTEFDGTLESIVKRNSTKVSCIDCGFLAPNQSRLNLHIRREHYFFC